MRDKEILLITKGHPFPRDAFFEMFDALPGVKWTHVEQPAAQVFFDPKLAKPYDAFVLYDMPGIRFRNDGPPDFIEPPARPQAPHRRTVGYGHRAGVPAPRDRGVAGLAAIRRDRRRTLPVSAGRTARNCTGRTRVIAMT